MTLKKRMSRNKKLMANCSVQDATTQANMIAFSDVLNQYGELLEEDKIVLIKASVELSDDNTVSYRALSIHNFPKTALEAKSILNKVKLSKTRRKTIRTEHSIPNTNNQFKKGMYIKVLNLADVSKFFELASNHIGSLDFYIYCEETKKIYNNPNIRVNNNEQLTKELLKLISEEELKVIL